MSISGEIREVEGNFVEGSRMNLELIDRDEVKRIFSGLFPDENRRVEWREVGGPFPEDGK